MSRTAQAARVLDAVMIEGARQFTAYRQSGPGNAYEIARFAAPDLASALAHIEANAFFAHKDALFVHERHEGLRVSLLHIYRMRKGTAVYRRNPQTGLPDRVEPLKADLCCPPLPVDAFTPTRPFDAFRDDPVGVDAGLIEGATA